MGTFLPQSGAIDFATVGRINSDARDDFLYGMERYGTAGGDTWVEFGTASPTSHDCEDADIIIRNHGHVSSSRPFYIGDIDGDGFSDFAVDYGEALSWDGVAYIYY